MSGDEIIAIAKEAGFQEGWLNLWATNFERFAALVAANEREACAQLCESVSHRARWVRAGMNGVPIEPCEYAAIIRARCNHVA